MCNLIQGLFSDLSPCFVHSAEEVMAMVDRWGDTAVWLQTGMLYVAVVCWSYLQSAWICCASNYFITGNNFLYHTNVERLLAAYDKTSNLPELPLEGIGSVIRRLSSWPESPFRMINNSQTESQTNHQWMMMRRDILAVSCRGLMFLSFTALSVTGRILGDETDGATLMNKEQSVAWLSKVS